MTVRITPEENSPTGQTSETSDQQFRILDDTSAGQFEGEYIPEREFVLMPLFRRIGQMLGIYRGEEPEYLYTPEPIASQPNQVAEVQPEPVSAHSLQDLESEEAEEVPITARAATEDILGLEEQTTPEPEVEPVLASEPEIIEAPNPQVLAADFVAPLPAPIAHQAEIEQSEPAIVQGAIWHQHQSTQESVASSEPAPPATVLTQQDATDLAAQIREAASRISMAVSQAAEWLHSKEEEILRRAETSQQPIAEETRTPQLEGVQASSLENPVSVPQWAQPNEVPALQRELAWQGERALTGEQIGVAATPQGEKIEERQRRLQVVSKPAALPFWKRIDWGREFAPKRVAILGAFFMAILMVLGISLSRRPAASVLPEQTRSIEPGGVTLTTRPAISTGASPVRAERRLPASRAPAAHNQTRAAGRLDDGPEVVTHYYGKPKPSPVRQAASSGVHHYSDLQ